MYTLSAKPVVDEARDCLPCVKKFRVYYYRLWLSEAWSGSWTSVLLAMMPLGVFRPLIVTPDGTMTPTGTPLPLFGASI